MTILLANLSIGYEVHEGKNFQHNSSVGARIAYDLTNASHTMLNSRENIRRVFMRSGLV